MESRTPADEFFDVAYQDVGVFVDNFCDKNYLCGSSFFLETNNSLFFSYVGEESYIFVCFYDKETAGSVHFANIIDEATGNVLSDKHKIYPCGDGKLAFEIPAEKLFDKNENPLFVRYSHKNFDDNFVLCLGHLK